MRNSSPFWICQITAAPPPHHPHLPHHPLELHVPPCTSLKPLEPRQTSPFGPRLSGVPGFNRVYIESKLKKGQMHLKSLQVSSLGQVLDEHCVEKPHGLMSRFQIIIRALKLSRFGATASKNVEKASFIPASLFSQPNLHQIHSPVPSYTSPSPSPWLYLCKRSY